MMKLKRFRLYWLNANITLACLVTWTHISLRDKKKTLTIYCDRNCELILSYDDLNRGEFRC